MDFKRYSIAEMISMISSNIAAIVLAFLGYGVWSLVWRLISQRFIFGALSFSFGKWLPRNPEFKGIKPLFNFGLNMLGSKMVYYFSENMVAILTGKFLGKEVLGLFNIAYNLAIKPSTKIQSILTSVLSSAFPKIQNDISKFRKNSMSVLQNTALFFLPLMVILAATSTGLIVTFYGEKWYLAGKMLLILSFVGILRGLAHLMRNSIIAKGNSRSIFYERIVEIIFSLPIMYFLMPVFGIYGLIIGYLLGALSSWFYLSIEFDKCINYRFGALKAISASTVKSAILFLLIYCINFLQISYLSKLIIQLVVGGLTFMTMLWFFNRQELMLIVNKLTKKQKL